MNGAGTSSRTRGGPIKPTIKCKCCPDCVIRLGFDFTQPDALIYSLIAN